LTEIVSPPLQTQYATEQKNNNIFHQIESIGFAGSCTTLPHLRNLQQIIHFFIIPNTKTKTFCMASLYGISSNNRFFGDTTQAGIRPHDNSSSEGQFVVPVRHKMKRK